MLDQLFVGDNYYKEMTKQDVIIIIGNLISL